MLTLEFNVFTLVFILLIFLGLQIQIRKITKIVIDIDRKLTKK